MTHFDKDSIVIETSFRIVCLFFCPPGLPPALYTDEDRNPVLFLPHENFCVRHGETWYHVHDSPAVNTVREHRVPLAGNLGDTTVIDQFPYFANGTIDEAQLEIRGNFPITFKVKPTKKYSTPTVNDIWQMEIKGSTEAIKRVIESCRQSWRELLISLEIQPRTRH